MKLPEHLKDKKYLTHQQLASILQISRYTIHRLVAAGRLPQPVRFTRKTTRFDIEEVRKALLNLTY
jgi:excisionase family DNA binding protein